MLIFVNKLTMKGRILIIIYIVVACNFLYSQKGIVNYGFIESLTIGNAVGDDYNAILKFDKNNSEYIVGKIELEKPENLNNEKVYENINGNGGHISSGLVVTPNGNQVITSFSDNMMLSNIQYGEQIYAKEEKPNILWDIKKNETKKIGSFLCNKAVAKFRGREYTAWFCPDIPIPYGPWKLCGLPGLILEAYDTNKNVSWYFKNIRYPANDIIVSTILYNEELKKQDVFLPLNLYSKKLEEMVQETNERSLIFSKQNSVDVEPVKSENIFLEIF